MPQTILQTEYSDEMQQSYINYSMSVITSRAVPDIRDGLKPVQRRVLYAMNELGLNSDKPHRKSARIVGDAMGKYHPHGDSSIYDALVVLSQDFKKGMALVDGHGNFGSIEGDSPAAMRYTEARLKKFTQDVYLKDLDKNTVDFVPNFDENEKEPSVLPVRVPNFLLNGSEGIAVGMTTSCPTHNLAEIVDAEEYLMEHPEATTEELMEYIKGPDFPTGGTVINRSELLDIYETGKGKIRIRGKAEFIPGKKKSDKDRIEITEIPYTMIGANIGKFLCEIGDLVEKKVFPDITDISNQSGKDGIKIVLELKNGTDGEKLLSGIYKKTKLEDTYSVNMLCICDGKPEVFGLKRILEENIKFEKSINLRKYKTLLEKEIARKEIQEGLIQAVDIIDLIIEIIRGSKKLQTAKECLTMGKTDEVKFKSAESEKAAKKLCFTENQAQAILELRLSKLIGLEILALEKEHKETLANIKKYNAILTDERELLSVIREDLDNIKREYSLPRRTIITDEEAGVFEEVPEEILPVVFSMNKFGYVKLYELPFYEKNKDSIGEEAKNLVFCMSNSRILMFTDTGMLHQIKAKDIPFCKLKDKGVPADNISNYQSANENIIFIDAFDNLKDKNLLFVTSHAMIKRVPASEFEVTKKSIAATKLNEGDTCVSIQVIYGLQTVLISDNKTVLKFSDEDIPILKKTSVGVRGMKLSENDLINKVYDLDPSVRCVIKLGTKRLNLSELTLKKRDGKPEQY